MISFIIKTNYKIHAQKTQKHILWSRTHEKEAITCTVQNNTGHVLRQQQSIKELKGNNNIVISDDIIIITQNA